jgi:hypothetical protein
MLHNEPLILAAFVVLRLVFVPYETAFSVSYLASTIAMENVIDEFQTEIKKKN